MNLDKIIRDFVSKEKRTYKIQIGKTIASSLAGFVAGAVVATLILVTSYLVFTNGNSIF